MSTEKQSTTKSDKNSKRPYTAAKEGPSPTPEAGQFGGTISGITASSIADQANRLSDGRLSKIQRQAIAAEIGRVQGNRHLRRVLAAVNLQHRRSSDTGANTRFGANSQATDSVQAKMTSDAPDDRFKAEADRVAGTVMQLPDLPAQAAGVYKSADIQRVCASCRSDVAEDESGRPAKILTRALPDGSGESGHTQLKCVVCDRELARDPSGTGDAELVTAGQYQSGEGIQRRGITEEDVAQLKREGDQYPSVALQDESQLTHGAQRAPDLARQEAAEPGTAQNQGEAAGSGYIVEDEVTELSPGQLNKSEFLTRLESTVNDTVREGLSLAQWLMAGRSQVSRFFANLRAQSSANLNRTVRRYAPETAQANSATDTISLIGERVRQGVQNWKDSGDVSGLPSDLGSQLGETGRGGEKPPLNHETVTLQLDRPFDTGGQERTSPSQINETGSASDPAQSKGQPSDSRETRSLADITARLGEGRPLDGGVRSRMETAFGENFAHVRLHTDDNAAQLSRDVNARAFTVGQHMAFNSGEYRPGTLIGDALIAHELAHVVQQKGAPEASDSILAGRNAQSLLEEDADLSTVGVMANLLGAGSGLKDLGLNALPLLRSGMGLRRCNGNRQSNCCCCVTKVEIKNVSRIDNAQRMGHQFNTVIDLAYAGSGSKKSCTLEWWEKTNVPYTAGMQANKWVDMYQLLGGGSFGTWNARTEPCPGNEQIVDTDPPSLARRPGRTVTRSLEFRIIVRSGDSCTCGNASTKRTAKQVLAMVNGAPNWANSSFVHPNPSDP